MNNKKAAKESSGCFEGKRYHTKYRLSNFLTFYTLPHIMNLHFRCPCFNKLPQTKYNELKGGSSLVRSIVHTKKTERP